VSAVFSVAWARRPAPQAGGEEAAPRDPHLSVHAVRVFVRDQEASLRFYTEKLGFHLVYDARLERGPRWVAVSPPDGSTVLSLVEAAPRSLEHKLIGRATQIVFVTEDFPAKFHEWRQRGVKFRMPRLTRVKYERRAPAGAGGGAATGGDAAPWGGMFARFEDLDGNSFTLASFDAESRAVEAQRRAQAEKEESDRRVAHELEIARQVQARLFPQRLPPARTLEYAGLCVQARQVGGDYYDFLDLGQDRLGLVVGDIAGKGIAAALLMAHLQATLRSQCAIALTEPERFLRCVNQLFCENTIESAYATLFFAEYDDRAQRLRYANCGHLSGLVLRPDGRVDRLESTSTVLGLFDDWDCGIGERTLSGGDVLALYTDGVTEAFDDAGTEFGEGRLVDSLRRGCELPAPRLLESVLDDVHRFSPREQQDDVTLIVARCRGN
jgi:serine phosphatase RsbU (regulator of sigma subunit)/catechol 2,3-dioxygenase-like lactoylglutathione lyase family enzyme